MHDNEGDHQASNNYEDSEGSSPMTAPAIAPAFDFANRSHIQIR